MWESIMKFIRRIKRKEEQPINSKDAAKERLHLVLMQDRANVSADFLELMKQEIIEVIKKYIDVDEESIDVRLTNKENGDGTKGAPALYANIPILNIKEEVRKQSKTNTENHIVQNEKKEDEKEEKTETEKVEDKKEKEDKTKPKKTKQSNSKITKKEKQENLEEKETVKVETSNENGQD